MTANRERSRLVLLSQAQDTAGRTWEVRDTPARVGRNEGYEILLDSASISREHARIERAGDGFDVVDLGSSNGTFVNGQPVIDRRRIADGDCLTFSDIPLFAHLMLDDDPSDVDTRPTTLDADEQPTLVIHQQDQSTPVLLPAVTPAAAPSMSGVAEALRGLANESEQLHRLVMLRLAQFRYAGGSAAAQALMRTLPADQQRLLEPLLQLANLFDRE